MRQAVAHGFKLCVGTTAGFLVVGAYRATDLTLDQPLEGTVLSLEYALLKCAEQDQLKQLKA